MALSNAERQRRWRERLKAKAAAADQSLHPDDLAMMRESWERTIEELRQQRDAAQRENRELRAEIERLRSGGVTNGDVSLGEARAPYLAGVARVCTTRQAIFLEKSRVTKSLDSMAKQVPEGKSIRL